MNAPLVSWARISCGKERQLQMRRQPLMVHPSCPASAYNLKACRKGSLAKVISTNGFCGLWNIQMMAFSVCNVISAAIYQRIYYIWGRPMVDFRRLPTPERNNFTLYKPGNCWTKHLSQTGTDRIFSFWAVSKVSNSIWEAERWKLCSHRQLSEPGSADTVLSAPIDWSASVLYLMALSLLHCCFLYLCCRLTTRCWNRWENFPFFRSSFHHHTFVWETLMTRIQRSGSRI